jgi:hypothetical protein
MSTLETLDLALCKLVAAGTVPEYTSLILRLDPSYMQPRYKLDLDLSAEYGKCQFLVCPGSAFCLQSVRMTMLL